MLSVYYSIVGDCHAGEVAVLGTATFLHPWRSSS